MYLKVEDVLYNLAYVKEIRLENDLDGQNTVDCEKAVSEFRFSVALILDGQNGETIQTIEDGTLEECKSYIRHIERLLTVKKMIVDAAEPIGSAN